MLQKLAKIKRAVCVLSAKRREFNDQKPQRNLLAALKWHSVKSFARVSVCVCRKVFSPLEISESFAGGCKRKKKQTHRLMHYVCLARYHHAQNKT